MPLNRRSGPHAGALVVAITLVASVALAFRPEVVSTVRAFESMASPSPTVDPTPAPTESAAPGPTPTVDPGPSPAPDPTGDPTPAPATTPTPDPDPDGSPPPADPTPTPDPSPDPAASPDPGAWPDPAASPDPAVSSDPGASADPTASAAPSASPSPIPGSATTAAVTFARVDDRTHAATYLAESAPLRDAGRFHAIRVRFRVVNPGDSGFTLTPRLEWRIGSGAFAAVPAGRAAASIPFYTAREWVATSDGRGSTLGPTGEPLEPAGSLGSGQASATGGAVAGERILGVDPGPPVELPARSWTEIEFAVRTSVDAAYDTTYELRLVDAADDPLTGATDTGTPPVAGTTEAVTGHVDIGPAPALDLTPGQLSGIPADPAQAAAVGVRYLLDSPRAGPVLATEASFVGAPGPNRTYPLDAGGFVSPHGGYTAATAACAACHRTHSAGLGNLGAGANSTAGICFTCHDGSGAVADVAKQYADPDVPPNDPTAGEYYRHAATVATNHTSADQNEFQDPPGTPILNRHSECGDCHDSHTADGDAATMSPDGWTAPGAITGISGVAVSNGAAGSAPTYASWTSPDTAHPVALEYELCLKCHSGFTELLPHVASAPSTWALDKGIEANPANGSTHPVEGPGSNGTAAMAASLTGTSPSKQWDFLVGDTVRCVNCHADPASFDRVSPPGAGGSLSPHVSSERGILFQPYRDRVLKAAGEDYAAADFALCYVCHAEAPFRDTTGSPRADTNFQFHGLHVSNLQGKGAGGTSIDTPGDGQGDAVCAECHFRIHSTALAYRVADRSNERLVDFAPNVTAPGAAWTQTGVASGTCTLTCHDATHTAGVDAYGPLADLILSIVPTPATFTASGQTIVVRYLVTNATGGPISGPVVVSDATVGPVTCPAGDLGVGATLTCVADYTTTSGDVTAGSVDLAAHADAGATHSNEATFRVVGP